MEQPPTWGRCAWMLVAWAHASTAAWARAMSVGCSIRGLLQIGKNYELRIMNYELGTMHSSLATNHS